MDRIAALEEIVLREVEKFALPGIHAVTYPAADHERRTYLVVVVPDHPRPFKARVMVMARVVNDMIIIDEDTTDRPLWQALEHAGIPREKMVLAYLGEEIPARE